MLSPDKRQLYYCSLSNWEQLFAGMIDCPVANVMAQLATVEVNLLRDFIGPALGHLDAIR
jgi:hypothetical protein